MLSWEVGPDTLRVTDTDNAELYVRGEDLSVEGPGPSINRPVDETIAVTASSLQFPHAVVYAFSLGVDNRYELTPGQQSLQLPPGEYIVDVDTEIKTYLRFSGMATIERRGPYESIVCTFPAETRVVFGFRSRHERPDGTITVPDSLEDAATAISHLASSHKTDSPDRSYPTLRGHPPLLERGDDLEIPPQIRRSAATADVELLVPPQYESLFVVAPLAYYLQATVSVMDTTDARARLRIPDQAVDEPLGRPPALEHEVERVLRKVFFLDCLVRNAGPYGTTLAAGSLLEALELDPATLYNDSPSQRLEKYLRIRHEAIDHRLPDWHLSTYVDASYDQLDSLPFLLDRMSLIYRPQTSELEGRELIERSLDDFYRGETVESGGRSAGDVASVDVVKPDLKHGRVHGWLADGVPIDVFKSSATAYENRLEYLERDSDAISIYVVLNEPEMVGERATVADIYRERSTELPIEVTVESSLSVSELARVFEAEHDFVHYIGHCETDGLRCPDGYLSAESLDRCRTQTFFLNACGSFYEGEQLIERGSVAGAVTFTKVLNEQAITVGSTFAKLLVHGFSIERAMRLARRRIMMGKDYAVVGDGTHSLTQGRQRVPTTIRLEPIDDADADRYLVTFDCFSTRSTGSYYVPHTNENNLAYLCGEPSYFTLTGPELPPLLRETNASVIYDGDIAWSKHLADELAATD